ncbi:MAG: right-handed parallel beta-helix repeat-containing protein, partial [Terriglobales bacterium]
AALAQASPGDRIRVLPGVYHEGSPGDLNAITISASGIELVGVSSPTRPVVLENAGGQSFGVWVSPSDSMGAGPASDPEHPPCGVSGARIHGFSLSGFTVRGFGEDGVHLACIDSFSLINNVIDANSIYGFFPVVSRNGLISNNEVMNTAMDAAIYVGQSDNVLIAANRVHDNLLGIEVENSRNCAVVSNEVHGNTLGIFVDVMPFLELGTQHNTFVALNNIHDNNRPNTAEAGDPLGALPTGIGILLTGADTTIITANTVIRNQYVGIGVVSFCLEAALLGLPCDGLDIEPQSDGNRIFENFVHANGTLPIADPLLDALRADLVWDSTGIGNCWKANAFGTSVPSVLPSC